MGNHRHMDKRRLGITWQLSDSHGWGVFGLNLSLNLLARDGPKPLLFGTPDFLDTPDDTLALLAPLFDEQRQIQAQVLDRAEGQSVKVGGVTVLHALANGFVHNDVVRGEADIGFIFFEQGGIDAEAKARAGQYGHILAGSSWNRDYARAHGIEHIEFISQGVDTAIFRPGPASDAYRDRFAIFSGGKLELRKGQDLVVAAFKVFHARHPDAVLITSWRNAWPESAIGMSNSVHIDVEPKVGPDGELMIERWAHANGIAPEAFIDLGWMANRQTAAVLRDMDVAVFPNRCEGGTNLVAMEAMASGVPCILSANTGHLDIIAGENSFSLTDQRSLSAPGSATEMWRESQIEEIVAQLETVYADRQAARRRAEAGAAFMADLSWANQTQRLLAAIDGFL